MSDDGRYRDPMQFGTAAEIADEIAYERFADWLDGSAHALDDIDDETVRTFTDLTTALAVARALLPEEVDHG